MLRIDEDDGNETHTLNHNGDGVSADRGIVGRGKDGTPGCTTEACEFRDNIFAFRDFNCQILGVSLDDAASHKEFSEEHGLPFPLLADTEGTATDAYGVKGRMFGFRVAKRQTFLIDPQGNIAKHYRDVDPDTHAQEVLNDLRELSADLSPEPGS